MLVTPPNEADIDRFAAEIRSRPPVLLVHGDQDQLIPVQALMHAAQGLAALEVPVEWHISPGVGHGIDQEGLRQGGEFLVRRLSGRATALKDRSRAGPRSVRAASGDDARRGLARPLHLLHNPVTLPYY